MVNNTRPIICSSISANVDFKKILEYHALNPIYSILVLLYPGGESRRSGSDEQGILAVITVQKLVVNN